LKVLSKLVILFVAATESFGAFGSTSISANSFVVSAAAEHRRALFNCKPKADNGMF